ncbi:MAG TPA: prepilin-type N-terminal cleavage/methylation domain-containing protein [Thermoanaerobaculia bacterium]|nr:prepilin-type N-terminal cleavage/methylation domain-containing protein [Thermoanaerobaculia bacterium]
MQRRQSGFTVAELITVCAIIAILAAVAMPVARLGIRRQKEVELRYKLRKITEAIDRYHDLRMMPEGQPYSIKGPREYGAGDYPKSLEELTKPIELVNGRKIRLLRERDLIDPMTGKNDWITLSDSDDPDTSSSNGANVYEVHSKSPAKALDGKTRYNEW